MKNLIFLTLLLFTILFSSCLKDGQATIEYLIVNSTDSLVHITYELPSSDSIFTLSFDGPGIFSIHSYTIPMSAKKYTKNFEFTTLKKFDATDQRGEPLQCYPIPNGCWITQASKQMARYTYIISDSSFN